MPELPEVELVARSLDTLFRERTIVSAELLRPRLAPHMTPERFASELAGRHINFVHRRGKHILFDLAGDRTLIVHLRMSGRFSLLSTDDARPKFTHAVFHLDGGDTLVFDDQRHFGLMRVVPTTELHETRELKKLAPEPFSDAFTPEYLYQTTRGVRRRLKDLLIDQTKVCGLGNIYACEAMFNAWLSPRRRAGRLSRASAAILHESIVAILQQAIDHSSSGPVDAGNIEGSYFNGSSEYGWSVYEREGRPCVRCGEPIVRIKQAGRSTYYCRKCQSR